MLPFRWLLVAALLPAALIGRPGAMPQPADPSHQAGLSEPTVLSLSAAHDAALTVAADRLGAHVLLTPPAGLELAERNAGPTGRVTTRGHTRLAERQTQTGISGTRPPRDDARARTPDHPTQLARRRAGFPAWRSTAPPPSPTA